MHCKIEFGHEFNEEIREIVKDEVGQAHPLDSWMKETEARLETQEGLNSGEISIDGLQSEVSELEELAAAVAENRTEAINTLNSHGEDMQSMQREIINLETRCATLLEQQLINQAAIAKLEKLQDGMVDYVEGEIAAHESRCRPQEITAAATHRLLTRQVLALTHWIAGVRHATLVATSAPSFLAHLAGDADPTPGTRPGVTDDKECDELDASIDAATSSLSNPKWKDSPTD